MADDDAFRAMKARLTGLLPRLNERDRRLALATETRSWGYTGFSSDIQVDAMRWKWVRLEPTSLSGVDPQEVTLNDPDMIHALLEHSANDVPLDLAAIVEGN